MGNDDFMVFLFHCAVLGIWFIKLNNIKLYQLKINVDHCIHEILYS